MEQPLPKSAQSTVRAAGPIAGSSGEPSSLWIFEEAYEAIRFFLMPISGRHFASVTYKIARTDLPERYPIPVLSFWPQCFAQMVQSLILGLTAPIFFGI